MSNSVKDMRPRSRDETRPRFASLATLTKQRAQGKPGADCTHGSCATKSTGVGPQVKPEQPGLPCAMVYGLLRALPGDRACLPPSLRGCRHPRNLAPASGRQDHTTSPSASSVARRATPRRPSHPAPNVRDDREAPLRGHGTRGDNHIFLKNGSRIFLREGLDRLLVICPTGCFVAGIYPASQCNRFAAAPRRPRRICVTQPSLERGRLQSR